MTNPVSMRLGKRNDYTARAHKKRVRQVANQLARESNWKGDLARSFKDVSPDDIDDCQEMYR